MTWGEGPSPEAPRAQGGPHAGPGPELSSPALPGRPAPKGQAGPAWGLGRNSDLEQGRWVRREGLRWTQGAPGSLLILHRWSEEYFVLLVAGVFDHHLGPNLFLALILEVVDTGPDSS